MKINIDLRGASGFGGIVNFKRNIAVQLAQIKEVELNGCYNWLRGMNRKKYSWFQSNLHKSIIPDQFVYHYALKLGYQLPFSYELMMNSRKDLNLFLTYNLPQVKFKSPVVATIHDIILLKTSSENKTMRDTHEKILRDTINKSIHILTVSESAKNDLIEYFSLSPNMISVVHNGITHELFKEELSEDKKRLVKKKYNLPNRFILYMGNYRKHKNIERLLEAYSLLPIDIRKDLKLVITARSKELEVFASKLKIQHDTIFCGFVDEMDKCAIYKSSEIVYYASLYEGFGVPIIEAQACGIPVITSNISSMPEASGGFAEHVNPYNVTEIYQAIIRLIDNTEHRNSIISGGYINSELYTWKRGAEEVYNVLNSIMR